MTKFCTGLLLCISFFSYSQKKAFNISQTYSVEQVYQDIDYTTKYLQKFHPDPYRYISKDSLNAFALKTKEKIKTPQTEMQLRFYLKQIVAKIGCGHTDVTASKTYAKALQKINRPIFPINAFVVDTNRVFVLNNLSTDSIIKQGDEIISIDNKPINKVLQTIYSIYTTDGFNETYKKQGVKNDLFKYYYCFSYGFKPTYSISLKQENGTVYTTTLSSISTQKDTLILPKIQKPTYIQKTKSCFYFKDKNDTSLAIIDINRFGGRGWRKFMRKTFKHIRKNNIQKIALDLRDNGGGQIGDGLNMLSYLIHKPFTLLYDRKSNLLPFNPRLKMGFFTRITPILFSLSPVQWWHKGKLRHCMVQLPKKRNAYNGKLFVLINGKSFSMSCIATSYLKYKANATIIGEETGGNVAGSNAMISGTLVLPNSKVRVFIPLYHIYHNIDVTNNAHGIIPDIKTNYTADDILNSIDLDLEEVLKK